MASSYSDLQTYRACPRLFGFKKLGYIPIATTEPLATGGLTHIGLAAHFKGEDVTYAVNLAVKVNLNCITNNLSGNERYKAEQIITQAHDRALKLLKRYITHWAKDYKAILVEPEFEWDGVICHPDLIAYFKDQRVIVDYKTSYSPDDRWYDISGQTDLYAYVLSHGHEVYPTIDLIIYDVISEEGIYRHMRPPRLDAGKRLFHAVQALNNLITRVKLESKHPIQDHLFQFLNDPHPDYTCPSRCSFWIPCWLLETDTWEACHDYLEENYLK